MKLFGKIYSVVLVLFFVVISFITLQVSSRRISETKKILIDKHQITGSLVTSEIKRWHAEDKWPFEALRNLATQEDDFLFWWIVADDDTIYLADKADFVGTNTNAYFLEIRDRLNDPQDSGNVVLSKAQNYGIYSQAFTVGNERWSFWLGFSTSSLSEAKRQIFFSTTIYSCISLIFLGLILFFIIRKFLFPLKELTEGVQRIGEGDLDWRVTPSSKDEIGIVAESFNRMAESLQGDIAKREKTEKQLEKSNALMESLIDSIPDLIFYKDKESVYLGCNNAFTDFVGHDKEAIIGQTDLDLFAKDIAEFFREKDRQMLAGGIPKRNEEWVDYLDGRHVLLDTIKTPFFAPDNEVLGLIGVSRDITERHNAEKDLGIEKEQLAVTLRSIGDGVITTDISGKVVLLNKVAEKLTGWSNEEAAGRPLEDVFHIINEYTREICENPVTKVISSGQIVGLANHTALVSKDGTERSIADSGAPILDAQSNTVGVVLVFRDVTEKAKTERELLKVKKLESIGVLAGGIAHDFNNILAAILGNINLAIFDENLSDKTRELLSEAEKASLRAKDLTQQLLTFSKGGEPVTETSFLDSVIKDSANFVLHGEKIGCKYYIPEDLWLVDIDKGQISQVIQNIVLNARHAMPEGGIINITCENLSSLEGEALPYAKDGKFVKICIQDNGIGIPANLVEKIFDPYFSTKQEGSGLGLAITQSIINKHHGHITVESTSGVGTTFTIYLPASEKAKAQMKKELSKEDKVAVQAKILIMDDEAIVRNVAQKMLDKLGHEVVLSADGEEALQFYQESIDSGKPFDLVIMDLTIPGGMGGKEAVREVLKIDPNAKSIVSSGYSNDPIMANFKDYGFCSAIVKPYQLHELERVISELID